MVIAMYPHCQNAVQRKAKIYVGLLFHAEQLEDDDVVKSSTVADTSRNIDGASAGARIRFICENFGK